MSGQVEPDTAVLQTLDDDAAHIEPRPVVVSTRPVVGADNPERTPLADLCLGARGDVCGL